MSLSSVISRRKMPKDSKKITQNPLVVIASNRGPYEFELNDDGTFSAKRGAGGLVTALSALAAGHDVLWVAAALKEGDRRWASEQGDSIATLGDIQLRLIIPDEDQYYRHYNVIANPLLWFIQHQLWDAPRKPSIGRDVWEAWHDGYLPINRLFAQVIADSVRKTIADETRPVLIFPQDYQLYLVPRFVRELLGDSVHIQPFIHIPWPGPDAWRVLPETMRATLLDSLLSSDIVGFQTKTDAFNFVQTARFYLPNAHSYGSRESVEYKGRKVWARAYPISIDVQKVESLADEPQTRLQKQQLAGYIGDRKLILRTDRIEPSKNILRGLQAYRALLEEYPEHRERVVMLALLVPSRMEVDEYQTYLQEIMSEAGMINAAFSDGFWEPVRIIVGDNYPRALAAMHLYDILLVNPIADGMNLVAKEGALINGRDGVLLLSEHAGAYYELGEFAMTVSPFDVYSTAQAMHQALIMPHEARSERAKALREIVRRSGIQMWFQNQVADALASQDKNDSTPDTPSTSTSAASRTTSGVSSDKTPTPTE